ncbi:TPA: hypothetical protein HA225_05305 [Candidatus Micrarchaeota archaeon]|nr:hypothetical protein [Candidatus Micrarchaeota archaeon]
MNRWDLLALVALAAAMAYAASIYYPSEFKSFAENEMVRVFAIIVSVAAFVILILDYFLKVFSKAAEKG